MRAVVVTAFGGPEALSVQELPAPEPGESQLLVDVSVAGVNFRDIYEREAAGYGPGAPPFVAGVEGTGTIAAVGPGVTGFKSGDRVAWLSAFGSYAERVLVSAEQAVHVPDGIDDETACALMMQGATAHYLTHSAYRVQPGDTVLVHAAAGGVGLLLTQIVTRVLGGCVIGTTSTEMKARLAREAGAQSVLGYREVPARVMELTNGRGVAVAYDGVGADTWEGTLDSLAVRGVGVLIGATSGSPEPVPLARLQARSLFVTRPSRAHYTATQEELNSRMSDLFGWVRDGSLTARIGETFQLEQARDAQEALAGRATTGKVLLRI